MLHFRRALKSGSALTVTSILLVSIREPQIFHIFTSLLFITKAAE